MKNSNLFVLLTLLFAIAIFPDVFPMGEGESRINLPTVLIFLNVQRELALLHYRFVEAQKLAPHFSKKLRCQEMSFKNNLLMPESTIIKLLLDDA